MQIVEESRSKNPTVRGDGSKGALKHTRTHSNTHTGTFIYRQAAEFSGEPLPQPASVSLAAAAAATAAALPPLLSMPTRVFLAYSFSLLRIWFLSCLCFALCRVCEDVCVCAAFRDKHEMKTRFSRAHPRPFPFSDFDSDFSSAPHPSPT